MTQDEALKLALEFLERPAWRHEYALANINQASTVLKEALAQPEQTNIERHEANVQKFLGAPQPEQEPFAYVNVEKRRLEFAHDYVKWDTPTTIKLDKIPLYTTPPQRTWVGLTDEDWDEIFGNALTIGEAIKATEAKLKEKNT